jgi:hypothetical protein
MPYQSIDGIGDKAAVMRTQIFFLPEKFRNNPIRRLCISLNALDEF